MSNLEQEKQKKTPTSTTTATFTNIFYAAVHLYLIELKFSQKDEERNL
jgi:hypothetical protein